MKFPVNTHEKSCYYPQSWGSEVCRSYPSCTHPEKLHSCPSVKGAAVGREHRLLYVNDRHLKWTFTITDVSQPLIGAHFLHAHSLLVDMKGRRIVD